MRVLGTQQSYTETTSDGPARIPVFRLLMLVLVAACGETNNSANEGLPPQLIENHPDSSGVVHLSQAEGFPMEIVLTDGAVIEIHDSETPIPKWPVGMDSQSRLFTASFERGQVAVWDTLGNLLDTFGEYGEGPFELQQVDRLAVGPADSIFVSAGDRIVVFSPDLQPARQARVPFQPYTILPLGEGLLAFQHHAWDPVYSGWRFHLVAPTGGVAKSFGRYERVMDRERHAPEVNLVPSFPGGGGAWGIEPTLYEIALFPTDGSEPTRRYVREVEWFTPYVERIEGDGILVPPRPLVVGLHETVEKQLWISVRVTDDNWTSVSGAEPGREVAASELVARPLDQQFDQVLEVLDVETGAMMASARFPGIDVAYLVADGLGLRYVEVDSGIRTFQFMRVHMIPRSIQ
jgi:hypothetical protein